MSVFKTEAEKLDKCAVQMLGRMVRECLAYPGHQDCKTITVLIK
jgi:hypothetical protein